MRKIKILKLTIFTAAVFGLGVFAFSSEAQAATNYYVTTKSCSWVSNKITTYDPTTDSCVGGSDTAYNSIRNAVASASLVTAGDTILVADGTYTGVTSEGINFNAHAFIRKTGTEGNVITIKAKNKNGATLSCGSVSGTTYGFSFNTNVSYISIEDFAITNCRHSVMSGKNNNDYITIKGNKMYHIGEGPAWNATEDYWVVDSNEIYDWGYGGSDPPSTAQYHGIYIQGANATVINNLVYDNVDKGWAIQLGGGTPSPSGTIKIINNTIVGSARNRTSGHDTCIVLYSAMHPTIYIQNNVCIGAAAGLVYTSYTTWTSSWSAKNNIVETAGGAVCYGGGSGNCTACTNGSGSSGICPLSGENINTFGTSAGLTSISTDDYTLSAGAFALDWGLATYAPNHDIINAARPQGSGYDIGAYEKSNAQTDYYISPSGTDGGNCTITSPCATLNYAQTKVTAGDTIYVRGGTYTATAPAGGAYVTWTKSGTVGNVITVKNYPNETPIFTTPLNSHTGGNVWGDVYVFVRTLESANVKYVTFEGLEIKNFRNAAFDLRWVSNVTIKNNNMHDMYTGPFGMVKIGLWDDIPNRKNTNVIIDGNRFTGVGVGCETQSGFHAIYPEYTIGLIIRNNYFEQPVGKYAPTIPPNGDVAGPAIKAGNHGGNRDVYIYNNVFEGVLNGGFTNWRGVAGWDQRFIWIGGGGSLTNHRWYIYNNTFYSICNNAADSAENCNAIRIGTVYSTMDVQNNIFHKSGSYYQGQHIYKQYSSNIETISHNIYTTSIDSDDSGVGSSIATPNQIAFVSALNYNFNLQSTSVAKEVGVNLSATEFPWDFATTSPYAATGYFHITTDKNGVTRTAPWSMGAYEYTGSAASSVDVNGDGKVNIKDIQEVIRCIINKQTCAFPDRSDVNGDGRINIKDIQEVIRKIINP